MRDIFINGETTKDSAEKLSCKVNDEHLFEKPVEQPEIEGCKIKTYNDDKQRDFFIKSLIAKLISVFKNENDCIELSLKNRRYTL